MARRVLTNSVVVLELTWVNADALLIGVAWSSPGPLFDSGGLGAQPSCSRRRRRSIHVLPGDLTIFCGSHKLIIDRAYSSCSRATAFPTASPAPAIAARSIRTAPVLDFRGCESEFTPHVLSRLVAAPPSGQCLGAGSPGGQPHDLYIRALSVQCSTRMDCAVQLLRCSCRNERRRRLSFLGAPSGSGDLMQLREYGTSPSLNRMSRLVQYCVSACWHRSHL